MREDRQVKQRHTDKQRRAHTRTYRRALIQRQTHDMHKRSAYTHIRLYLIPFYIPITVDDSAE